MTTRRTVIAGGALLAAGCTTGTARAEGVVDELKAIETRIGGRLGVYALDAGSKSVIGYRAGERFSMCSTFKWLLAAAVLKTTENNSLLKLDMDVSYSRADILPNSPITEAHLDPATGKGSIGLEKLLEAIVTVSDNCGANLLLDGMIPPEGLTRFIRQTGDTETRLDRRELELNYNEPNDPRDTTTPEAMARSMMRIMTTDAVLNAASREKLARWLVAATPGLKRLRAGLPANWRAGDKTGTGRNGAFNDVLIAWPPGRRPIAIACYLSDGKAEDDQLAAAHAEVARTILKAWS
jgi:beta-lactamase class A